jgi:hypothetical protein
MRPQANARDIDTHFANLAGLGFESIGPPHPRYWKGDGVFAVYWHEATAIRLVQLDLSGVLLTGFVPFGISDEPWEIKFTANTPAWAIMGAITNLLAILPRSVARA